MSITCLGFHHVALQVRDVERVASFYRDVLGLAELKRWHRDEGALRSIWLSSGAQGFLAVEHLEHGQVPPAQTLGPSMIGLTIDPTQRRTVEAALVRAGVAIEKTTGWTVYVRDPEGTLVGLSHHPHDAR